MGRSLAHVNSKELLVALTTLAVMIWACAAFNSFAPGMNYRTGPIKGADFVHFYTLGHVVAEGRADLLYDEAALLAIQLQVIPGAERHRFIPVYGPQTALLFAGLAGLPYLWAALVWGLLTIGVYVVCVWACWRGCPALQEQKALLLPASLGFVPLYLLATSGQTSVLPLVCLTFAYLSFRSDRKWWAGAMLGSLIIKPHLGLAAGVVMLACREWRVIGGAVLGVAAQWGVSAAALGIGPLLAYFEMLPKAAGAAALLEPQMDQLHSLRAFWLLLLRAPLASSTLYALTSAAVLVLTVRVWRAPVALEPRYAALVLATVLVTPHLGTYDLVLVAPAMVLTAQASKRASPTVRRMLRSAIGAAYLAPLTIPLTPFMRVQLTTIMFSAWLLALSWAVLRAAPATPQEGPAR